MSQRKSRSSDPPPPAAASQGERDLRLRLEEAEETLRAIRSGQVDAVVISGPSGDQVFTLRGADQPYRVILQTMHEGALTLARNGTVLYCNQRLAEMLDTPLQTIAGRSILDFAEPGGREAMTMLLHRASDEKLREELRLCGAQGVTVPVMLSTCPLISDGMQGISAVVTDLTEQKRAEFALKAAHDDLERRVIERTAELVGINRQLAEEVQERRQVEEELRQTQDQLRRWGEELEQVVEERTLQIQRLERQRLEYEKSAAVGRMAARIAHEINNPLAGVKNSFRLVKGAIPPDHRHYEFVGRIDKEIDRIARIVRQMFEIYKPEHKEPGLCRPALVIADVADLLQTNSRTQGVTIEVDAHRAAQHVMLHEDSLRQVLFNIIQNAIEASPAGGVIQISAEQTADRLTITVADSGPGIPPELQTRIFEPFFTTKEGLTTGGLGLGLSITQSTVQALGGSIQCGNRPEGGASFTVTLPAQPQTVVAAQA